MPIHLVQRGHNRDACYFTDERQAAYRALFRSELESEALADIRLALNQGQPLGNGRFLDQVERMVGRRCEVRPRGRPRKMDTSMNTAEQQSLPL